MLPKSHALLGLLFCIYCYLAFNFSFLALTLIFFANLLIDFDHYLFFVFRKKSLDPIEAYKWNKDIEDPHPPMMHVLHCVEFFILIGIIAYFYFPMYFIFIGFLFHSIIDLIDLIVYSKRAYLREYFFTRYLLTVDKSKYF